MINHMGRWCVCVRRGRGKEDLAQRALDIVSTEVFAFVGCFPPLQTVPSTFTLIAERPFFVRQATDIESTSGVACLGAGTGA